MTGDDTSEDEAATEPNLYLATLERCRDTVIPTARDRVYDGNGKVTDAIANPVARGGWVCDAADEWIDELVQRCDGVLEAFEEALDEVRREITVQEREPDVPEGNWRGNRWPQNWAATQEHY